MATSFYDKRSNLFRDVPIQLITAISVYAIVATPPDGSPKEFLIGDMEPNATLATLEERFGDGSYRLVANGAERGGDGSIKPVIRDSVTIRVAKGIESTWKSQVLRALSLEDGQSEEDDDDEDDEDDEDEDAETEDNRSSTDVISRKHAHAPHEDGVNGYKEMEEQEAFQQALLQDSERDNFVSYNATGGMLGAAVDSGEPYVIPVSHDEKIILARGLSSEEMQKRIDAALAERKIERQESQMNEKLIELMNEQIRMARIEKELAEKKAESFNSKLLEVVMSKNSAPHLGPEAIGYRSEDMEARVRSLVDTIEQQRRHIAELEDKVRRDRFDHWEEVDRYKKRLAEYEEEIVKHKRRIEELQMKMAKTEVEAVLSGAKTSSGNESEEEKLQKKLIMFAQLAQNLAPVVGPMLSKMGIIPADAGHPPPAGTIGQGGQNSG